MAYSELIKNFNRIRDYMREFYVYGFKSREEYTKKSARSYDDERRRLESWLGDYMRFRQTPDGKNVFLSIDSRVSHRNPLYKAWRVKSFTDGDVTLHFILLDILYSPDVTMTLNELTQEIDRCLRDFRVPRTFDASTVRKKLNEYVREGVVVCEKRGKTAYYRRVGNEFPERAKEVCLPRIRAAADRFLERKQQKTPAAGQDERAGRRAGQRRHAADLLLYHRRHRYAVCVHDGCARQQALCQNRRVNTKEHKGNRTTH